MIFSGLPLEVLSRLALLAATATHRPEPTTFAPPAPAQPVAGLEQQLKDEGSQQCWKTLVEIIIFLLDREAYPGTYAAAPSAS
ncbi:egg cell-secreted protein 1.3-like [Panicum miliaceum]|uniref:Egg cell-secreted protein 1.3-like n=1 Tax=Panicum miliaceum TaxID=4540 RepID=A0A3L6PCJ7_PANMI|nr:egg cell-secreted protein 1.3-like [Panicum miliaceum]